MLGRVVKQVSPRANSRARESATSNSKKSYCFSEGAGCQGSLTFLSHSSENNLKKSPRKIPRSWPEGEGEPRRLNGMHLQLMCELRDKP